MGLFRRGAKLLKIGSALRDCCCRPEKPEECFCPGMCAYVAAWSSLSGISDGQRGPGCEPRQPPLGQNGSVPFGLVMDYDPPIPYLGGFAQAFNAVTVNGIRDFFFRGDINYSNGFRFEHFHSASGQISDIALARSALGITNLEAGGISYRSSLLISLIPYCNGTQPLAGNKFMLRVQLNESVSVSSSRFGSDEKTTSAILYFNNREGSVDIAGVCINDSRLFCDFEDKTLPRIHLPGDLEVNVDSAGFSANGQRREFGTASFFDAGYSQWRVEGRYPFQQTPTITIKRKVSCKAEPCDCTASLANRTVLFEGKEMTYGQLDNFYFPGNPGDPYSGTWWVEDPVGTFTRRDVENCDGTLNQRVKVVEIDCINEGGVDKWVAYLDHTCNERDDAICPGPADAQRVKQWTGFFLCDENGSPTGSPTELEVDYDVTAGTPAAECVDALQPPSFEFL